MVTKAVVDEFLAQPAVALAGLSRSGKKFGNSVLADLKAKGIQVFPVHPEAREIQGQACYPNLAAIPEKVGGIVLVIPPEQTEKMVREALATGIKRVWMQPGAESKEAIRFCKENGMQVVTGECIMMYPKAESLHKVHRAVRTIFGRMPK